MSTITPIRTGTAIGLRWDAILACRGSDGKMLAPASPVGNERGPWKVLSFTSPADPMWAPNEMVECPICRGSGERWQTGVAPEDVWPESCSRCAGAGEVRVAARYVGEFEPSHRRNLYSWMMRRAPFILGAIVTTWYDSPFGMDDGLEHAAEEAERALGADPWGWLASQPFMLALGALLIGDGNGATVAAWERRAGQSTPEENRLRVDAAVLHLATKDL